MTNKEILKNVPVEFHQAFLDLAWNLGHGSGVENVDLVLEMLVDALLPSILVYGYSERAVVSVLGCEGE